MNTDTDISFVPRRPKARDSDLGGWLTEAIDDCRTVEQCTRLADLTVSELEGRVRHTDDPDYILTELVELLDHVCAWQQRHEERALVLAQAEAKLVSVIERVAKVEYLSVVQRVVAKEAAKEGVAWPEIDDVPLIG